AFAFWVEKYQQVLTGYGGDPSSGRKLAARFVEAAIPAPTLTVVQRADLVGEAKSLPWLTIDATSEASRESGLASADELEAALAGLAALAEDDTTLCGSPRIFQAWARRPGG